MSGFEEKIRDLLVQSGVPHNDIYTKIKRTLPGYFRATKNWDLLVVSEGNVLAAIDLKSMVGSAGKNLNNRLEEVIGLAHDFWIALRNNIFQQFNKTTLRPWLGYLYLFEDCEEYKKGVKVNEPHFPVLSEFNGASYTKRLEILCRKLAYEKLYDSTCLLRSNDEYSEDIENYIEPASDLSASQFTTRLLDHVKVSLDVLHKK